MFHKKKFNLNNKNFFLQKDFADCGVACLQNILCFYGGHIPIERLREMSGTDANGVTLFGLRQAAIAIGFEANGAEAPSLESLKMLEQPCILYTIQDNRHHYIVCYKWDGKSYIIGDPFKGIVHLSDEELSLIWNKKIVLLLTPTSKIADYATKHQSRREWLYDTLKKYMHFLLLAAGLGLIASVLNLSTAVFSQKLIDKLLPNGDIQKILVSTVLLTFLLIFRSIIFYIRGFINVQQLSNFNKELTGSFYRRILHLPKSFFDHRKTGDMIARLNDTNRIQQAVSMLIGDVSIQALLLLVAATALFIYSFFAGIIGLLFVPVIFYVVRKFQPQITHSQKNVMVAYAQNESNYIDHIRGIGIIKLFNREQYFFSNASHLIQNLQQANLKIGKIRIRFNLTIDILATIFLTGLILCSIIQVLHHQLLPGGMIAVLQFGMMIMQTATAVALTNFQLQEAKVAFDRMYEFTQFDIEDNNSSDIKENEPLTSEQPIRFETLTIEKIDFRFPGRPLLLRQLSIQVRKGKIAAIVGESGQGKSTIFQLIQKFYAYENGSISINGNPLNLINNELWRKIIGVVTQEPALFSGSVIDNILLNPSGEAENKAVIQFCMQSGLHDYFVKLPQGYATRVGEGGVNISGGQKQLICLARCLFHHPQLLLLDEPTAAMDKNMEAFVIRLLLQWRSKAGVIVISHKDALTHIADAIYELENGTLRIRETEEVYI